MDRKVFISCAHADLNAGRAIAQSLQQVGVSCDLALEEGRVGDNLAEAVAAQIDRASAYVILVGADSMHSQWARRELTEIIKQTWSDKDKGVLMVILDRTATLPGAFADCRTVHLEQHRSGWEHLHRELRLANLTGLWRTEDGAARLARRLAEVENVAADLAEEGSPE